MYPQTRDDSPSVLSRSPLVPGEREFLKFRRSSAVAVTMMGTQIKSLVADKGPIEKLHLTRWTIPFIAEGCAAKAFRANIL